MIKNIDAFTSHMTFGLLMETLILCAADAKTSRWREILTLSVHSELKTRVRNVDNQIFDNIKEIIDNHG